MSVMGTAILGTAGPYVHPEIVTLVYSGNAYPIPRLRYGDIFTKRSKALIHQDIPFAAPEWPVEDEFKMTFMVRCQRLRGLLVTALNHVYLWEEFFRAYIGRPMFLMNPITEKAYYIVLTGMGYSEIDAEHVNMDLTFTICEDVDFIAETTGTP